MPKFLHLSILQSIKRYATFNELHSCSNYIKVLPSLYFWYCHVLCRLCGLCRSNKSFFVYIICIRGKALRIRNAYVVTKLKCLKRHSATKIAVLLFLKRIFGQVRSCGLYEALSHLISPLNTNMAECV